MRIRYRQWGGVAGLAKAMELDMEHAAPALAQRITTLARACEAEHTSPGIDEAARDQLKHCIEIDDGDRHLTLVFDEVTATPRLRALAEELETLAKPVARGAPGGGR